MRLTRGLTEATSAVTAASSSLSELAPEVRWAIDDIRETAREATVAFAVVTTVALVALLIATYALVRADG